jgi:hypothetical protein
MNILLNGFSHGSFPDFRELRVPRPAMSPELSVNLRIGHKTIKSLRKDTIEILPGQVCFLAYLRRTMGIYVEIPILGSMDELWEKTQSPELHQRWDLRFTEIEYLPRKHEEPQEFLYRTRIGFGITIDGKGESTGTKDGDGGTRTSSLKFWSDDPKSLIKVGSGYWKYVPTGNIIRFFTWYDYQTRFGPVGNSTVAGAR